ncbi:MAG: hypothetical protein ACOX8W_07865 [bacterium]|jgi:hypothetical protein
MAARPVDFQTSLPKLPELSRIQHEKDAHWQVKNQQFAAELQQLSLTRQQKVINTPPADKTVTDREAGKDRKQKRKAAPARKAGSATKTAADNDSGLGQHIDIRA